MISITLDTIERFLNSKRYLVVKQQMATHTWPHVGSTHDIIPTNRLKEEMTDWMEALQRNAAPVVTRPVMVTTQQMIGLNSSYTVKKYSDNSYSCACPVFLQRQTICHHIKTLIVQQDTQRPRITYNQELLNPMYLRSEGLIVSGNHNHYSSAALELYRMMLQHGYSISEIKTKFRLTGGSGDLFDRIYPVSIRTGALTQIEGYWEPVEQAA